MWGCLVGGSIGSSFSISGSSSNINCSGVGGDGGVVSLLLEAVVVVFMVVVMLGVGECW